MNVNTYFQLADAVSLTHVDDEAVLLNLNDGLYYGLNNVGVVIVDALLAQQSLHQVIATLVLNFQVDELTATKDTNEFIQHMLNNKLLCPVE